MPCHLPDAPPRSPSATFPSLSTPPLSCPRAFAHASLKYLSAFAPAYLCSNVNLTPPLKLPVVLYPLLPTSSDPFPFTCSPLLTSLLYIPRSSPSAEKWPRHSADAEHARTSARQAQLPSRRASEEVRPHLPSGRNTQAGLAGLPKGFPVQGEGDAVCGGEGAAPQGWAESRPLPSPAALSRSVRAFRGGERRPGPPQPASWASHRASGPGRPAPAAPPRLTAVGVRGPRQVGEGAGLAGEGDVVVQEAAAACERVFRVAASDLQAGERTCPSTPPASPPSGPLSDGTHQAGMSPAQGQDGAGEARGQGPVAG